MTQAAKVEDPMRRFVRLLYFSYLGREASDQEMTPHVSSGLNRGQLAFNFMNSAEFNLGGRFTAGLYVGLLSRDAEFNGWQFQRQALARGIANQDQLVANFLNSAEFKTKFGTLTDGEFVRLMYTSILLRDPAQSEVDGWASVLADPANTRAIVARSFLNSSEFQRGTGPRLLSFLLYATLFLRDSTAGERASLETQLAIPGTLRSLIDSLANSEEINRLLQ